MSINIVRGPQGSGALQRAAAPLPEAVMHSLVQRALDISMKNKNTCSPSRHF